MDRIHRMSRWLLPTLLVVGGLCARAQAWTTEDFQSYAYADATVIPNGTTLGAFKYYASNGKGIYFDASGQWGSKGIFRNWDAADGGFNDTDLAFTRSDRSAFDLQSIFLWDDFNGSPNVILRGFRSGVRQYRLVVDPQSTTAGFTYTLNWSNVDSVTISDSTDPPAYPGTGADLNTFIDNIVWEAFVPPTATTGASSSIGSASATVAGSVNANNHSTTDSVQYGTTTGYGTTVVASPATATGTSSTSISASLTGLTPNTLYHWRVKATSAAGTGTGGDATFTTTKAAQTITFTNPGTQNFGTTPTASATSTSGLAISFSSTTTGVCTTTGAGTMTFLTTGTCTIGADQAGNGTYAAATTVSRSFSVVAVVPGAPTIGTATAGDGQATVAFTAPTFTGGSSITGYTVTSNPGGLTGTGSSSPITVTGLTNGTAYTFTVTATNGAAGTGSASTASNAVTPKTAQAISFTNPGTTNFGTTPTLTATATSTLAVTFSSSTTGVCTITSGGGLTTVTAGTCTIDADQAGNGTYSAAPTVGRSFSVVAVVPGAPTIGAATAGDGQAMVAFTPPTFTGGDAITGYTATSNPGGITGSGASSPITVTGLTNGTAYTFTVTATNGAAGTGAASTASNSVTPKTSQTITFTNPGPQNFGTTPTLTATASSTLAVSFTSTTTGVCTITSGGALTTVTTGTCTIDADQAGDGTYSGAATVGRTFSVVAVAPDAPTIGTASAGDAQASVSFTAPTFTGGASITTYMATSNPGGLTGSGTSSPITVTGLSNGTAYTFTVTATNGAGPSPASAASNSVTPQGSQTITFADPGTRNLGTTPTLTATSTSGLAVSFSSSTTGVCTITTGGVLTTVTTGTCTILADQAGNAAFTAAPTVTRSFAIQHSDALSNRPVTKVVSHDLGANVGQVFAFATRGTGAARLGPSSCTDVNTCLSVDVVLPEAATVSVAIFDNLGAPVIAFDRSVSPQDLRNLAATSDGRRLLPVSWNLRAGDGAPVPSGVYLWKISVSTAAGQKLETVKRLGGR